MQRSALSGKLPMACCWTVVLLGAAAVLAIGCRREPPQAGGSEVPEAVPLIRDAEERCARIARQGLERFQGAEQQQQPDHGAAAAATAAEKGTAPAESPEASAATTAPSPDPKG